MTVAVTEEGDVAVTLTVLTGVMDARTVTGVGRHEHTLAMYVGDCLRITVHWADALGLTARFSTSRFTVLAGTFTVEVDVAATLTNLQMC